MNRIVKLRSFSGDFDKIQKMKITENALFETFCYEDTFAASGIG